VNSVATIQEIIEYRELVKNMVSRDLKIKYKDSILGYFWSLVNPLLMFGIYTVAFHYILKIQIEDFPLFFIIGFLPWSFVNISLMTAVSSIVDNGNLVNKVYFPTEIIPLSIVLSSFVQFLLTFVVLFPVLFFLDRSFNLPAILTALPLLIFLQVLFVLGLALFFSAVHVFFRDTKHFLEIFLTVWFFLSPIIYTLELVPERVRGYFMLNPMALFLTAYRDILMRAQFPDPLAFLEIVAFAVTSVLIGWGTFSFFKAKFSETV